MKKYILKLQVIINSILVIGVPTNSFAWTPSGGIVTIDQIIEWESNQDVVFKTSEGHYCYIPSDEKNMYSLVLSLMASGKTASIHCHDLTVNIGGFNAHRVHRVIANR